MKLIKLTCPNCGAKLDVELQDGKTQLFCQYCGQKILVNPDYVKEINIHQVYTDEAKLKELEVEEKVRAEEKSDKEHKRQLLLKEGTKEKKAGKYLLIISILIIVMELLVSNFIHSKSDSTAGFMGWLVIVAFTGIACGLAMIIEGIEKVNNNQ